jgi:hypothetical protein
MTIKLQGVLLRWSIFFPSPSLYVTLCLSSAIYSFPSVDRRPDFNGPHVLLTDRRPLSLRTHLQIGVSGPTPPVSLDAIALGCAARFNLPKLDELASIDGRRFQGPLAVGQFLSSGCMADLSEDGEIFDFDDGGLPLPQEGPHPFRAGG